MARPGRNASPYEILRPTRTFFATTKTDAGRRLLQSERNAELFMDVLRTLVAERVIQVHDFVVMPDHAHLLITIGIGMTVEKAMQLIKGRFSYRLKKEYGYLGEVWQRGFSEVQIMNSQSLEKHRVYIAMNPVKAGLATAPGEYPFCYESQVMKKVSQRQRAIEQVPALAGAEAQIKG
ncbi:MAG TPA: transposase [Terracidiphilus sp.]|jgi:putative transposase